MKSSLRPITHIMVTSFHFSAPNFKGKLSRRLQNYFQGFWGWRAMSV